MKILGIGNAIVDVICKVEDNFLAENKLTKSTMKLIFDDNNIFAFYYRIFYISLSIITLKNLIRNFINFFFF